MMLQTSSFYFQKAENIHNTMTVYMSALIGLLVGLTPVVVSFLFITQYSGTLQDINSGSFNISIEAKSELAIEQLMQLDSVVIFNIFPIAVSILIIPIYYYILKYREYKLKFIKLHTMDIIEEFIGIKKWMEFPPSLNDQIELYGYVNRVTCFPKNDILDVLVSQYKDKILLLLIFMRSKIGTDIIRNYVKAECGHHDKKERVIFDSLLDEKKAAVIFELYRESDKNINALSESTGFKESKLSRIIKWLEDDGLVHSSNSSGEGPVLYRLDDMVNSELVKLSELKYISKSQSY